MTNKLHVVYSTDDNYAPYTGISIISLLENNEGEKFCIWIIDNQISKENKIKIEEIGKKYSAVIEFIDFEPYKKRLNLNMMWSISISSYARLFISEMLPLKVNRVLYLDSDVIVINDISSIFEMDMKECVVAGVLDLTSDKSKLAVGLSADDMYINAGVLLLNLELVRDKQYCEKFIRFIDNNNGQVHHHDQGVLNAVMNKSIQILPMEYNMMTPSYTMKYEDMICYYGIGQKYYRKVEVENARKIAKIIHFTPGFVGRPWEKKCLHPMRGTYLKYKKISPWKDISQKYTNSNIKQKVERAIYIYLPFSIAHKLVNALKNIN